MPKIIMPEPEVEKEFELLTFLISPPKIKLRLKPFSSEENFKRAVSIQSMFPTIPKKGEAPEGFVEKIPDALKVNVPFVLKQVLGWDLVYPDGKPIACNKNNKLKFLAPLLWEKVKADDTERLRFFMGEIIDFISDLRNFIKN